MDVHTGEILALASLPTFDPNRRETFHAPNLRNRAITDTFEPGSIMKPFTAALALDLGRINTSTQFETRSEEHTSELQSLLRTSYAVFCLTKKNHTTHQHTNTSKIVQNHKHTHK